MRQAPLHSTILGMNNPTSLTPNINDTPLDCKNVVMLLTVNSLPLSALHFQLILSLACSLCVQFLPSSNLTIDGLRLCKEGNIKDAKSVLAIMTKHGVKLNVVTYNSLMDGYCLLNELNKAIHVFNKMTQSGVVVPNVQSYNIMINGFFKSKLVDEALNIFEEMRHKNLVPNTLTYNTLIDGLCKSGRISCALELVEKMQDRGQYADVFTYSSLLDGMFKKQELDKALGLFNTMKDIGIELNIYTYTIIIDGLCKSGRLIDAKEIFHDLPNVKTYTVMINGLCKEGLLDEALALKLKMEKNGSAPNIVTYEIIFRALLENGTSFGLVPRRVDVYFFCRAVLDELLTRTSYTYPLHSAAAASSASTSDSGETSIAAARQTTMPICALASCATPIYSNSTRAGSSPFRASQSPPLLLRVSLFGASDGGGGGREGCLYAAPSLPQTTLIQSLQASLSKTLSIFPPLAGTVRTTPSGHVYVHSNDSGVDFIHATAASLSISDLLSTNHAPNTFQQLFPFHNKLNYTAHFSPIMAIQVTELADGLFFGVAVNHAVTDGASLWHFFNTFAEFSRGAASPSRLPDFRRDSILVSDAFLRLPEGDLKVSFNSEEPLRERIFSFSRESIQRLKAEANRRALPENQIYGEDDGSAVELTGKMSNDTKLKTVTENKPNCETETVEISSFQSLCALTWRAVTHARKIPLLKTTTFRMAVNIRNRMEPKLGDNYFGNAIQSIATCATAEEVVCRDLRWSAMQLNNSVRAYDSNAVKRAIEDWEREPRCFVLGNHDGATVQMGSSPRFPMYDNDFGWGKPVAVRSGAANKFDGKMSAFPGRNGGGSVDLEVVLAPDAMAALECDDEFMLFASG
ncbi:hypothetical protein PIB30_084973 [Stylosanthes scabra]|uniref:BAHD acyltransferase DCR n=1 Tax=Stylosanthes scabra TaxID=79078 RepID=A0ABU6ST05_9FABA|nr:hypothetical protein [Stylosanthes scabra]